MVSPHICFTVVLATKPALVLSPLVYSLCICMNVHDVSLVPCIMSRYGLSAQLSRAQDIPYTGGICGQWHTISLVCPPLFQIITLCSLILAGGYWNCRGLFKTWLSVYQRKLVFCNPFFLEMAPTTTTDELNAAIGVIRNLLSASTVGFMSIAPQVIVVYKNNKKAYGRCMDASS
ncbi:hypothetical protein PILCRDRAFT_577655 [Piloderma croceum F 1598]|uniref:Uncharacterized protein n=1 Tax=Piloderma croceum (strain F 1598) TaxID=765440 RepID=A0A0C3BNG0_PILCF|nr:hypothetical protein PILCRDRAFT_577655 [Piloderma croceum F 1598]